MRVRRLQVHPPGRDNHVVAYSGIDVVVETEAGYAVIVGVEGPFGIFAENRAEGVDEWFPDVGPVPAGPGRNTDGHADSSRCQDGVLDLQEPLAKGRLPFCADIGTGDLSGELRG